MCTCTLLYLGFCHVTWGLLGRLVVILAPCDVLFFRFVLKLVWIARQRLVPRRADTWSFRVKWITKANCPVRPVTRSCNKFLQSDMIRTNACKGARVNRLTSRFTSATGLSCWRQRNAFWPSGSCAESPGIPLLCTEHQTLATISIEWLCFLNPCIRLMDPSQTLSQTTTFQFLVACLIILSWYLSRS